MIFACNLKQCHEWTFQISKPVFPSDTTFLDVLVRDFLRPGWIYGGILYKAINDSTNGTLPKANLLARLVVTTLRLRKECGSWIEPKHDKGNLKALLQSCDPQESNIPVMLTIISDLVIAKVLKPQLTTDTSDVVCFELPSGKKKFKNLLQLVDALTMNVGVSDEDWQEISKIAYAIDLMKFDLHSKQKDMYNKHLQRGQGSNNINNNAQKPMNPPEQITGADVAEQSLGGISGDGNHTRKAAVDDNAPSSNGAGEGTGTSATGSGINGNEQASGAQLQLEPSSGDLSCAGTSTATPSCASSPNASAPSTEISKDHGQQPSTALNPTGTTTNGSGSNTEESVKDKENKSASPSLQLLAAAAARGESMARKNCSDVEEPLSSSKKRGGGEASPRTSVAQPSQELTTRPQ